jgi:hypothetical protein
MVWLVKLMQLTMQKHFHYTNTVTEQNLDPDPLLWLFHLLYIGRLLQVLASGGTRCMTLVFPLHFLCNCGEWYSKCMFLWTLLLAVHLH